MHIAGLTYYHIYLVVHTWKRLDYETIIYTTSPVHCS